MIARGGAQVAGNRAREVADLRAVLHEAWRGLAEGSPNRLIDPGAVVLHPVDSPSAALPQMLRMLCAAA